MEKQTNRPVKEFRAGTIKAAIWANETESGAGTSVRYSVQFQKRFRDNSTGSWRDSRSFFPEDLPRLGLVVSSAFEYCVLQESSDETDADISSETDRPTD